jgi:hypothetical protein
MAYPGNKKPKKKSKSLFFPYTREDMKRVQWCLDKNIHISCSPINSSLWKIEIRLNKGDWKRNPGAYEPDVAHIKMYEYYKYYYDKYNKE